MLTYVVVGSGYRAEYFGRVARTWPEQFRACYLCRSDEKAARMRASTGAKAVLTAEEALAFQPDFVVVAVDRGHVADVAEEWIGRGFPVVTETPVGDTEGKLIRLEALARRGARIVCCEQYHRYPILAAGLEAVRQGAIGTPQSATISLAHDYHAASLLRRALMIGRESYKLHGSRQVGPAVSTDSRTGAILDGSVTEEVRDRALIDFESGKTAIYDFAPLQYRSYIRSRHFTVRGERGEWSDTTIYGLDGQGVPCRTVLAAACETLADEDPLLRTRYVKATGELQMEVMGGIQLEILQEELKSRFDLNATFEKPTVIYRETIARAAEGYAEYTWPKPCWAILRFIIRPAPRGSGVRFRSQVPAREIAPRYQHQVEQALPLALNQGRLGWQVTDVDITLVGGSHHQFHTHPLDFIVATPWGIQDGLQAGGSVLLEPILELRLRVPQDCVGHVMSDVTAMRGEVTGVESGEDFAAMTALVPVASSMDYAARLAQSTNGRGGMSVRLHSYRECPMELGATAARRSVDPLDTSKYILAARSALEGGIFDLDG